MLADGRDCRDVVTQISAANKALEQAGFVLVAAGLTWCLEDPERSRGRGLRRRRRPEDVHEAGLTRMFFRQYDLACLSLYSYLIGDTTTGPGRRRRPAARHQRVPRRRRGQRPAHRAGASRPTSTPTSCPATSSSPRPPARSSPTATWPQPDFPIEPLADGQRALARRGRRSRSATRPATRPSRSRSSSASTPDAEPWAVLTGDTLFIGDVGRPDLLTSVGCTADEPGPRALPVAARAAADPARRDARATPPTAPARPAASTCRPRPSSTIGEQRATNYALAADDRGRSSSRPVTEGQGVAPLYFAFAADANRRRARAARRPRATAPLTIDEALALARDGRGAPRHPVARVVRLRAPARARSTSASTAASPSTPAT